MSETAYELGAVLGTTIMGGILAAFYRANLVLPAGLPDAAADAARETLAGAVAASHGLEEPLGQALRDAAAHAFDAGVGVTALIGAALIVIAAVDRGATLGGRRTACASSTESRDCTPLRRRYAGRDEGACRRAGPVS